MKKIISVAIVLLMLLSLLSGCNQYFDSDSSDDIESSDKEDLNTDPVTPGGSLKGSEAAKLLLAQERLNSQLLKNDGDIFENGAEVFRNLASIAKDNLVKYTYEGDQDYVTNLSFNTSTVTPLSSVIDSKDGSKLEIDGNLYKWSDFAEYSNSYDYFTNLTNNVISSAESAAKQIDDTKKHVRVIDKWVNVGGTQYYLHVEDNCEILYERQGDYLKICKRSKDDAGINVYEIYNSSSSGEMRMTYIQGRKYEYTYSALDGFNHNFIAENTKGFWEVLDVGNADTHYNVSCMVVKDDICYDAFYEPNAEHRGLSLLKVISADKKTDIVFFSGAGESVELSLQAFDGIKHIQIEVAEENVHKNTDQNENSHLLYVEQDGKRYYLTTGVLSAEIVLENGMVIREGDVYLDGRVHIGRTIVSFFNKEGGTCGYAPWLELRIEGDSYEERMEILNDFLDLTGLDCRRDMDYVKSGIIQAYDELAHFVKYQQWNESPIATEEDLQKGFENLDAKYKAWRDLYDTVKDGEVIDYSDKAAMELNIKFAPITSQKASSVKNDGLAVSVTDLSLSVEDTTLLVENEPYMVNFALLGKKSSGLVHIEIEGSKTTAYAGEKPFAVSQTASFVIPALSPDEYTVVAYISTADGIRMSGYTELVFTEVAEFEERTGNIAVKTSKGSEGELVVSCEQILDVEVSIAFDTETVSYDDMYSALSKEAYNYGYAAEGAEIEVLLDDGNWAALAEEEKAVLNPGTYRLRYEIKNGDSIVEGYVITQYAK